jgi:N-acetylneuraminic acid mutarotase
VLLLLLGLVLACPAGYLVSTALPCPLPAYPVTPDGGVWADGAVLPTARSELAAAALGSRVYVAGGLAGSEPSDAFEVYDAATGGWRRAAGLPEPLHHTALAAAGEHVYLTGGYRDLAFREVSRATWRYDPARDAWEPAAAMPGPRGAHIMAAIGDRLYVVGGTPDGRALWAYDPARDAWESGLAPMPTDREHLAAAVAGGRLYAIGGRAEGAGNVAALEVYDPASDRWEALTAMPAARGGLTAAALDSRIFVGGGEDPWARLGTGCAFDTLEVYDTTSRAWSRLPALPGARHGLASAVVDSRWYVIGGASRPTFGTVFSYSDRVDVYTPGP